MAYESNQRVAFYADGYGPDVAANRLRLLQPMAFLQGHGVEISRYDHGVGPKGYDTIIVSRAHTSASLRIAETARSARRRVVYDICDNLFAGYRSWHDRHRAPRVAAMIRAATVVTTPTRLLGDALRSEVPDAACNFQVIPDALESRPAALADIGVTIALDRLRRFLRHNSGALHCVWFGSSAKNLSGFAHLDRAVAELERFARHHPVTLTLISDARWRYTIGSRRWTLPTFYQPYALGSFQHALSMHRVAVIPLVRNSYTAGKSINRPATAILAGLGVVADALDSYEELRPFIALDDWQAGFDRYRRADPAADPGLAAARAISRRAMVSNRWENAGWPCSMARAAAALRPIQQAPEYFSAEHAAIPRVERCTLTNGGAV